MTETRHYGMAFYRDSDTDVLYDVQIAINVPDGYDVKSNMLDNAAESATAFIKKYVVYKLEPEDGEENSA